MPGKFVALSAIASIGAGAFVLGSPDRGEYYEMSRTEVASRLVTAKFPGDFAEEAGQGRELSQKTYRLGDSQIVWEFGAVGQNLASLTANLEPEGDGTRVSLQFDLADSDLGHAARKDMGEGSEMMEAFLKIGVLEHIDATLDGREFDDEAVARNVAKFAMSHPMAARKFMKRVDDLEKHSSDMALAQELKTKPRMEAERNGDEPMHDPSGYDPTPPDIGRW